MDPSNQSLIDLNFFIASISTKLKHYIIKASILLAIIIMFTNLTLFSGFFAQEPVQVYVLAGQSNMEGKGGIDLALNHQVTSPNARYFFVHLLKGVEKRGSNLPCHYLGSAIFPESNLALEKLL